MPNQCVNCGLMYPDDATDIMAGCSCGAKAFFFIRTKPIEALPEESLHEHVKTTDGKYDLDLSAMFGSKEIIIQQDEGKYSIDLEESFRQHIQK